VRATTNAQYELDREAMEPPMCTALKIASMASVPGWSRFVLVNDRVPRSDVTCALCCMKIGQGYVRELQTGLVYCDPQCFSEHEQKAFLTIEDHVRKVS
jgi:hypothetical protein